MRNVPESGSWKRLWSCPGKIKQGVPLQAHSQSISPYFKSRAQMWNNQIWGCMNRRSCKACDSMTLKDIQPTSYDRKYDNPYHPAWAILVTDRSLPRPSLPLRKHKIMLNSETSWLRLTMTLQSLMRIWRHSFRENMSVHSVSIKSQIFEKLVISTNSSSV